MAQAICKVCMKQFARYTCPRCNLQYCSLNCYKIHGDRCTEGFYSENVAEELRQTKAGGLGKRQMMDILERFHTSDAPLPGMPEGGEAGSDIPEEGDESGAEDREEDGLSSETLAKIMAQIEQGQDLDIQETDLSPAERAAFQRAIASGSLARLVSPWEPWWRSQEAAHMSLSAVGTRVIRDPSAQGDAGPSTGAIPPPPDAPLPRLAALSKAQPSPQLRWQLVDILYSYCLTLHLYNGEWTSDPQGAAATALAASAALGGQRDSAAPAPPPASAAEAVLNSLSRACHPSLSGAAGRGFAVSVLDDVQALLQCGRPAIVCALTDLRRAFSAALAEATAARAADRSAARPASSSSGDQQAICEIKVDPAARESTSTSSSAPRLPATGEAQQRGAPGRGGGSALRKRLQAAERKLAYFQAWANEQQVQGLQVMLNAVVIEATAHRSGMQADTADDSAAESSALLGRTANRAGAQRRAPQEAEKRPQLVQELDAEPSSTEAQNSSDQQSSRPVKASRSGEQPTAGSSALLRPVQDMLRETDLNESNSETKEEGAMRQTRLS